MNSTGVRFEGREQKKTVVKKETFDKKLETVGSVLMRVGVKKKERKFIHSPLKFEFPFSAAAAA